MPVIILCILLFIACSEPAAPSNDAGGSADTVTDDDALVSDGMVCDLELTPPAAPTLPAPVDWGVCPDGWDDAADGEQRYCLPRVAAGCPAGTLPVIGEAECVQLCEEYDPPDGVALVDVAAGGDLQAAIDAAPDGAVVRIAAGKYPAPVTLKDRTLIIVGACPGEAALGGLSIDGGAVTVRGVAVRDAAGWAVSVTGNGRLTAERLYVTGGDPEEATGGIFLTDTAAVSLTDCAIEAVSHVGIRGSGKLDATRLLVRGVTSDAAVDRGKGMEFTDGAQAALGEVIVEDCTYGGLSVSGDAGGAGASLTAGLLVVRSTKPSPHTGKWGYGIAAIDHAALKLTRTLVSDNHAFGVAAMGIEGMSLGKAALADVIIADTHASDDDGLYPPRGLDIDNGITAELDRVAVLRSENIGMMLMGPLSADVPLTVTARDITVSDTVEEPFGLIDGQGIVLLNETEVTLERTLLENNRTFGLLVSVYEEGDYTTRLTARDLTVRGTRSQALDNGAGIGLGIYRHAAVTLDRTLVEGNRTAGVLVYGDESGGRDTTLTARDLTVRGTLGQAADGEHGIGVAVQYGARALFERASMEENRMYGVMALGESAGPDPMLTMREIAVRRTLPRDCLEFPGDCPFAPGVPIAHGLGVYSGATAAVGRMLFAENAHGLDVADGSVSSSCEAGYCVAFIGNEVAANGWDLPPGYDMAAALGKVCIEANGTLYSGDTAPVPGAVSP